MEKVNLNACGVVEMQQQETREVNGGNPFVIWFLANFAYDCMSDPARCADGFVHGMNYQY